MSEQLVCASLKGEAAIEIIRVRGIIARQPPEGARFLTSDCGTSARCLRDLAPTLAPAPPLISPVKVDSDPPQIPVFISSFCFMKYSSWLFHLEKRDNAPFGVFPVNRFLLSPPSHPQVLDREGQMDNPCTSWLADAYWDNITELDKLTNFHGLMNSFEQYPRDWNLWYTSATPEKAMLPGAWAPGLPLLPLSCPRSAACPLFPL